MLAWQSHARAAAYDSNRPDFAIEADVRLAFIRPGKPVENEYIESFDGRFRDECLNEHWFVTMDHARRAIETWREEYNAERPHRSLADLTPKEYARRLPETAEQKVSLTADSTCEPD